MISLSHLSIVLLSPNRTPKIHWNVQLLCDKMWWGKRGINYFARFCFWSSCVCKPLNNALQSEITEAVSESSVPELHVLLTGRTGEQHGGRGCFPPPSPWVCPTYWERENRYTGDERKRQTSREETWKGDGLWGWQACRIIGLDHFHSGNPLLQFLCFFL